MHWKFTPGLPPTNLRHSTPETERTQRPPTARKQKRRNMKLRKSRNTTKNETHIWLSGKDIHQRTTAGNWL
jgi:hypothetical protein